MNIEFLKKLNKDTLLLTLMLILALAIPASVFLVQNQVIFKSRAGGGDGFLNAFRINDSSGKTLSCDLSQNPPVCTTSTKDITIKLIDIETLIRNK